jgi:hypothetical protein
MNQTTQSKGGAARGGKGGEESSTLLRVKESDAASVVQRIRQEATDHPYRTIGFATLAGMVLSNPVGRTLAGWAGMRMGWDILLSVLRDRGQAPVESRS